MAHQKTQTVQKWNLLTVDYDVEMNKFTEGREYFGRCSKEDAIIIMNKTYPSFWFQPKPYHGFGGYWIDCDGNVRELIPAY